MKTVSEAFEDLGIREKPKEKPVNLYAHFKTPPKPIYSDKSELKKQNLAALQRLDSSLIPKEGETFISLTLGGKKFDFWPHTDCWYSHSKDQYGVGIMKLIQQIETHLLKVKPQ